MGTSRGARPAAFWGARFIRASRVGGFSFPELRRWVGSGGSQKALLGAWMLRRFISSSLSSPSKVRSVKAFVGRRCRCVIRNGCLFFGTRDLMEDRMDVDPGALTLPQKYLKDQL